MTNKDRKTNCNCCKQKSICKYYEKVRTTKNNDQLFGFFSASAEYISKAIVKKRNEYYNYIYEKMASSCISYEIDQEIKKNTPFIVPLQEVKLDHTDPEISSLVPSEDNTTKKLKEIGAQIEKFRLNELHMRSKEFSFLIGITESNLNRIEKGLKPKPLVKELRKPCPTCGWPSKMVDDYTLNMY